VSAPLRSVALYRASGAPPDRQRHELLRTHARLIERHARAVAARTGHDAEEFWAVGAMALLEAIPRYDPSLGAQLETFIGHRVRGAMLDEVRRLDRLPRRLRQRVNAVAAAQSRLSGEGLPSDAAAIAEEVGCSAEESALALQLAVPAVDSDTAAIEDHAPGVFENMIADERVAEVERAVQALPERLRTVLALRYVEELPQRDIARLLGISEARVSQLVKGAVVRLRESLAGNG
jgi:RNA polymerase sigma factor for flagellar operon FliA